MNSQRLLRRRALTSSIRRNNRLKSTSTTSSTASVNTAGAAAAAAAAAQVTHGQAGLHHWLWQQYTDLLIRNPLLVKSSTASLIFFVSDTATQCLTEPDDEPFHWSRAGSGAAFGVVATTWLHYWWGFLETVVNKRLPVVQHRLANTLTKVVVDQSIGAPIYIFTYYCITHFGKEYMSLLSSSPSSSASSISEIKEKGSILSSLSDTTNNIDNDNDDGYKSSAAYKLWVETVSRAAEMLPPTMIRHWSVWPLVHTINFYFFSLHHRVLVQNLVLVGWSGYLSHLNNGGLASTTTTTTIKTPHQPHGQLMTPEEEVESVAEETILRRRESLRTAA
jgi:Mpv17 / PMP22 family